MNMRVFSMLFSFEVALALSAKTTKINSISQVNASQGGVFMITSGLTSSSSELCLTVQNGQIDVVGARVVLAPCSAAIAAGDGRELFSMQPSGELLSAAGKLCVALDGDAETGTLALAACGSAGNVFELEGSGQIKFGKDGQYCVSQRGHATGSVNVATDAAVSASSSAPAHGPSQAVAGIGSYWASQLGGVSPVEFVVDLGSATALDAAEITWEYPAKSFSVMVDNGGSWSEVFSTSINSLQKTHIPLGSSLASKVKITMLESHPLHGVVNGQALYGISSLELKASGLKSIIDDCAAAAKSMDCRDKYFLSYVGEYDSTPAKSLRGELPALESAQTSLAATTAELAQAVSKLDSCGVSLAAAKSSQQNAAVRTEQSEGTSSPNAASAKDLLEEARAVVLQMRSALK